MANVSKKLLPIAIVAATAATQAPAALADLNVDLRTFYFNRDFSEGSAPNRVALTQAIRVDYTNELTDRIAIGASLFANAKLDGHGDDQSTGLLTSNSNSYAKLGQIFADVKLAENASVRLGRWVVNTPLLNDSDSRATPSSTQAVKLSGNVADVDLYALYSDRASAKADASFEKYGTDSDGLVLIGGGTKLDNGISLHAAYGESDNFLSQAYFNAAYTTDQLLVDFHHYDSEGEGSNTQDATLTNLAAQYSFGNLALTGSFQTVGGDTAYGYTWGGNDDNGLVTWNAVQIMDFNNKDEDSFQVRADYAFAGIQGLKAMVRHTWGEYNNGGTDVDEAETNAELKYTLQSGELTGLSLRMRLSHVEADAYNDINEVRLIANYSF